MPLPYMVLLPQKPILFTIRASMAGHSEISPTTINAKSVRKHGPGHHQIVYQVWQGQRIKCEVGTVGSPSNCVPDNTGAARTNRGTTSISIRRQGQYK